MIGVVFVVTRTFSEQVEQSIKTLLYATIAVGWVTSRFTLPHQLVGLLVGHVWIAWVSWWLLQVECYSHAKWVFFFNFHFQFLQDTLDALFNILMENSDSDLYNQRVFDALVQFFLSWPSSFKTRSPPIGGGKRNAVPTQLENCSASILHVIGSGLASKLSQIFRLWSRWSCSIPSNISVYSVSFMDLFDELLCSIQLHFAASM